MKAGNRAYNSPSDIDDVVPIFPVSGALLLPGGQLPLNIFEPRYLAMVDDAIRADRLIGMIQPKLDAPEAQENPPLCETGCLGRITAFQESGDGRMVINLSGICRYRIVDEVEQVSGYRRFRIEVRDDDLNAGDEADQVDRGRLIATLRDYLEANRLEADWESVERTSTDTLVNALCMMSPYGPAEKQALLEAPDLRSRAETLIAITEFELAKTGERDNPTLQ